MSIRHNYEQFNVESIYLNHHDNIILPKSAQRNGVKRPTLPQ